MATVIHRDTFEVRRSVNTPDYGDEWIVQEPPGGPKRYWQVEGNAITTMNATGQAAADAEHLAGRKEDRKEELEADHMECLEHCYPANRREALALLLTEAMVTGNIERTAYINRVVIWAKEGRVDLYEKQDAVEAATTINGVDNIQLDLDTWIADDPEVSVRTAEGING